MTQALNAKLGYLLVPLEVIHLSLPLKIYPRGPSQVGDERSVWDCFLELNENLGLSLEEVHELLTSDERCILYLSEPDDVSQKIPCTVNGFEHVEAQLLKIILRSL